MEQFIEQLISTGPVGIVCAAVVYLVIAVQRNNTKKVRDDDRDKLITRITLIEKEIDRIKALDLDARLASIETSLKYIQMLLEGKER
jgi:hypothetical protein